MHTGDESLILDKLSFKGQIAFSPNGTSIAYGLLKFRQGIKCSQLMAVKIADQQTELLKDCTHDFRYSPNWIDHENIVYLRQAKDGAVALFRMELGEEVEAKIAAVPELLQSYAYSPRSNLVALVSRHQQQWQLNIAQMIDDKLIFKRSWPLAFVDQRLILPQWQNSQRILLANNKDIFWFEVNGAFGRYPILSTDNVHKAVPYRQQQLIVEMGRADWDVNLFNWAKKENQRQTVSRSIFRESMGQFRPEHQRLEHQDVSLLSLRSGKAQIWLSSQGKTRQLSHSEAPVESYVWSTNGKKLAYLAGGQLFIQNLSSGVVKALAFEERVTGLFQWIVNENGEDQLLIEISLGSGRQIVSLNLIGLTRSIEYDGGSQWAQKTAPQVLIINDQYGKLQKLSAGKLHSIEALLDVKLQWRYFLRGDYVYFLDKQLNIWRLNPDKEQAEIVGHFDKNALLMTDILPQNQQLLSESFVSESSELMLIK